MTSRPTELDHPGTTAFIRRRALRPDFGATGAGVVDWQNVVIVDAAGGGNATTIQSGIDSITDQSATNKYLVLVNGGLYTEATITLKQYVYLAGRGRDTTRISVTNASGGAIVEANDSGIFDIGIFGATTGSDWTLDVDTTRGNTWIMSNVQVTGRSRLGAGEYTDCHWRGRIEFNGASSESMPILNGGTMDLTASSASILTGPTGDYGVMTGVTVIAKSGSTQNATISLGDNIICSGCTFINDRVANSSRDWSFTSSGFFAGCTFGVYDAVATGTTKLESTAGKFNGCTFQGIQVVANATGGPLYYNACMMIKESVENDAVPLSVVNSASAGHYPTILTGCTLENRDGGNVIDTTSSGGSRILELNGNTYRGKFDSSILELRLRGTDLHPIFFPPSSFIGATTTLAVVGNHPVLNLAADNDVCYIPIRIHPPSHVANIVDALLLVSGNDTGQGKEDDRFTEGVSDTALASHTGDSGGTWVLVSGTATVRTATNDVDGSSGGIHTWSIAGAHGFMQIKFTMPSSTALIQGMLFRYADTDNYWRVVVTRDATNNNTELKLIKRVSGSETVIAETDIGSSGAGSFVVGVSFLGDDIKVFCDTGLEENGLVFETNDSDLNTNTTLALLFGGTTASMDDLEFWPGVADVDITIDADFKSQEGAPLRVLESGSDDSVALTNQAVAHEVLSYLDISAAFTNIRQGALAGVKITLADIGALHEDIRVHGILLRTLPSNIPIRNTQSITPTQNAQQIVYR